MKGSSPGRLGSVIGTQTPSPGADHDFNAGPGSFGRNAGRAETPGVALGALGVGLAAGVGTFQ